MLSIGILTFNAPNTLYHTLDSYKNNELLNYTDDIKVWIQYSSNQLLEEKICRHFNVTPILCSNNKWIGPGYKGLVENAKYDKILLVENDFRLIENKNTTYKILDSAQNLLDNNIDMIKLRNRYNPGYPNWAVLNPVYKRDVLLDKLDGCSGASESIYWCDHPDKEYPQYFSKISDDPLWYTGTSHYCNFTNNPCMYRKDFYKQHIFPFCEDSADIETKCTKWWFEQKFQCAFGNGLFEHVRFDGK